ncbi:MAG: BREX-1 system adenine-specific DNA-methyltransferase PglX [Fimbriimonadaceae bacterium]
MNTANLKSFAPEARRLLIEAVTAKALRLGVAKGKAPIPATIQGEIALIEGSAFPKATLSLREKLIKKVAEHGFDAVMEEAAYTWFNRLMAIRYMEVHGYLSHGLRVLSDPAGGPVPEVLQQAQSVEIPTLDKALVTKLLVAGDKQEELYQTLLLAQCHALGQAMPFLFDRIDGATELLTPDNLLGPNSIVRKLVKEIPEDDWRTTEILGWLYQFYVSDEKARVDAYVKKGQAVEPEDIPAKTQLFTPNWIVQFLTQNSLGRLWMDVYPNSPLREKMPYYTPPAQQEPEVTAKLREITPDSLDPNTLTAIDPAAGSGHILLELYNLFFAMYQEQGYMPQDIPRRILEQNLYGLELDRRAAQIAGFAVLMRARADDPRLLADPPKVNVLAIRSSKDLDPATLLSPRQAEEMFPSDRLIEDDQPRLVAGGRALFSDATMLRAMKELFADADVVGSLQRIPEGVAAKLDAFAAEIDRVRQSENLFENEQLPLLAELVRQAQVLAGRYSVTAMNPPYMGGRSLGKDLKAFLNETYRGAEKDVFAAFMVRSLEWTQEGGYMGFMSPFTWMFISTFESLRRTLIDSTQLSSWIQLEYSGFEGATVPVCTFTLRNRKLKGEKGSYIRLSDFKGAENQAPRTLEAIQNPSCGWLYRADQDEFKKIPGWPIAYFTSDRVREIFQDGVALKSIAEPKVGLQTGENARFVRSWWEVGIDRIGLGMGSRDQAHASGRRWFPYNKGGEFRKWYGNQEDIIDWERDGLRLNAMKPKAVIRNPDTYFKKSASWSKVTSGSFVLRHFPQGFIYDVAGCSIFGPEPNALEFITCALNSAVVKPILADLSPTLNFEVGQIAGTPIIRNWADHGVDAKRMHDTLVELFRADWNEYETSWEFERPQPSLGSTSRASDWWNGRREHCSEMMDQALALERANNEVMAEAYGLLDEIETAVDPKSVSLWANPLHVFRPKRKRKADEDEIDDSPEETEDEAAQDQEALEAKFREKGLKEQLSYALGCMMGRYSLDEPGLIYAHAGGEGFDPSRYRTFPADEDGILPLTDQPFFSEQDTAERFAQWVKAVWPNSPLEENLAFIADNLGRKPDETPLEAIRRYLVEDFYADHLQTYKKRPIYWLFSSGKKRAFQALVYLHRYHPGTLGRMRSHYVQPLIGKLQAQLQQAQAAESSAPSASEKAKRSRETKKLREQYDELLAFDEKLHHYAVQAIALDLDDGVKVNYGKFSDPKVGDILAKVKDIAGGKDD